MSTSTMTKSIEITEMRENAGKAATLLKAISNESRLLILCHLGKEEMSVSQLNQCIDMSQSSLSQHLARLRKDGLVMTRREAKNIYYRISSDVAMKLIMVLHSEYCA